MTLLSLSLTPMTIISAMSVIYLWFASFKGAVKDNERTAVGWLIIGVVINFSGSVMDNIYWGFAWSSDYVNRGSDMREFFFNYGVYSNTFFRQITGVLGALCHVHGGMKTRKRWLKGVIFIGAGLGLLWVALLYKLKGMV